MKRIIWQKATLAVALAVFSSTAAMGQPTPDEGKDWKRDLAERIQLHGYASGQRRHEHV